MARVRQGSESDPEPEGKQMLKSKRYMSRRGGGVAPVVSLYC